MAEDRTEETNGQVCETCGTAVSPTANYCPNCGSALVPRADVPDIPPSPPTFLDLGGPPTPTAPHTPPPRPYSQASRGATLAKAFLIGCLMGPLLVLALLGLLLVLNNLLD